MRISDELEFIIICVVCIIVLAAIAYY